MSHGDFPRILTDFPRLPGCLKTQPADFVVEEIPAYEPSGTGEHLYLWVEKRDLAMEQCLRSLARSLQVPQSELGYAGMKDRRAVTRQWISVPAHAEQRLDDLTDDRLTVLDRRRHTNKLRTGHLRGNRFSILVRPPAQSPWTPWPTVETFLAAVSQISQIGYPNFYGDQRFGQDGETRELGMDLLLRKRTPRDIPYSRRRFLLKLSLSAAQSHLFNLALSARMTDGLIDRVLPGDVLEVCASGGLFVTSDAEAEQQRCDGGEVALTGPIFGTKMKQPQEIAAAREQQILDAVGLSEDAFAGFRDLLPGTRRRLLIRPEEFVMTVEPEGVRCNFVLPAGAFATTLLSEFFDLDRGTAPESGPAPVSGGEHSQGSP